MDKKEFYLAVSNPDLVWKKIEEKLARYPMPLLSEASAQLRSLYRERKWRLSTIQKWCYAAFRMPATYAVIHHLCHQLTPTSVLDLGAGPGTASFALDSSVTSVEQDADFIAIGKELGARTEWIHADLALWSPSKDYDLTLLSYSYGEIPNLNLLPFWNRTRHAMLLIEPGTPQGWENLLKARTQLLEAGAYLWAPCAHSCICPLQAPDWCHFGIRFQRPSLHRKLKEAELAYEEEKFMYLLMGREPCTLLSRIIRPPQKRSGHVILKLCTPTGLATPTLGRGHPLYKTARGGAWGDSIPWENDP